MKSTVLLVEDEPLLSEATAQDLEDMGLNVLCARDCDEGWRILTAEPATVALVTDIRTPGELDGWGLAIRARHLRPVLPVIYVSGFSAEEPQPVSGSLFLKKPYRVSELQDALTSVGVL